MSRDVISYVLFFCIDVRLMVCILFACVVVASMCGLMQKISQIKYYITAF
jgi:hypothetical protein